MKQTSDGQRERDNREESNREDSPAGEIVPSKKDRVYCSLATLFERPRWTPSEQMSESPLLLLSLLSLPHRPPTHLLHFTISGHSLQNVPKQLAREDARHHPCRIQSF